jgi:hypothetical protein
MKLVWDQLTQLWCGFKQWWGCGEQSEVDGELAPAIPSEAEGERFGVSSVGGEEDKLGPAVPSEAEGEKFGISSDSAGGEEVCICVEL